jgi:hypothetical protein
MVQINDATRPPQIFPEDTSASTKPISGDLVQAVMAGMPGRDNLWCAGSAAIIPRMARDIDLWYVNQTKPANVLDLYRHIPQDGNYLPWSEFDYIQYVNSQDIAHFVGAVKMFYTRPYGIDERIHCPIHIFWTTFPTIEELVGRFDLSIHAGAVNPKGQVYLHPQFTGYSSRIRILRDDGEATMRRLYAFTKRYDEVKHG